MQILRKVFFLWGGRTNGTFHSNYRKLLCKRIIITVTCLAAWETIEQRMGKQNSSRPVQSQKCYCPDRCIFMIYDFVKCLFNWNQKTVCTNLSKLYTCYWKLINHSSNHADIQQTTLCWLRVPHLWKPIVCYPTWGRLLSPL